MNNETFCLVHKKHMNLIFFPLCVLPIKNYYCTKCLPLKTTDNTWYKTLTPLIAVVVFRALFSIGGFKGGRVWDVVLLVVRFNRRNKIRIFRRHHHTKEDNTHNNKA
tara:strand:+ start:7254 stop:7574 length:321 start_codon:yes stop_codon:yes gene_type:complete